MIAFENVKYSSKPLKSKVVKEQIVKHVCEKYRDDLGEMKLELFKNSGGYEDLIKDCCVSCNIFRLNPHSENKQPHTCFITPSTSHKFSTSSLA